MTRNSNTPNFGEYEQPKQRSILTKVLLIAVAMLFVVGVIAAIGGYFYWRHLKTTPQYSLALLVDAARADDQKLMDEVLDVDAVVDDFVPQIMDKAVDMYGRGVNPKILKQAMKLANPVIPVVKQRAKAELPRLIREKTKKFEDIPFWAIAAGADRYLEIREESDKAFVKSKLADRPLEVEMKRAGTKWKIVALKDEKLAQEIAGKIGQEIIGLAQKNGKEGIEKIGRDRGIKNVKDLIRIAEDIFK